MTNKPIALNKTVFLGVPFLLLFRRELSVIISCDQRIDREQQFVVLFGEQLLYPGDT